MDNKKKINLIIVALASALFLFANIYAVRKIMLYGAEAFFYDKMLVAYQVGSEKALKAELDKVLTNAAPGLELKTAQDFQGRLPGISKPEEYLSGVVEKKVSQVKTLRQLRTVTFVLLILIFLVRIYLK